MNISIPVNDDFDSLETLTITDEHMDNNRYVTIKLSTSTTDVTFAFDVLIEDLYYAIKVFKDRAEERFIVDNKL